MGSPERRVDRTAAREAPLETLVRRLRLVVFDFDGVFTDNAVFVFEDGREAVRCWRGDGLGLRLLQRFGIETCILSTETNPVVTRRAEKLGLRSIQGVTDKLAALKTLAGEGGIGLNEVAFVGNDVNDADCLAAVGLPIVVADAHPAVKPLACYRTTRRGGYGAVREVCDLIDRILSGRPDSGGSRHGT